MHINGKFILQKKKTVSGKTSTRHWFFNKNSFVVWKKNDIKKNYNHSSVTECTLNL